jgi:hypothetical protein
MCGQRQRATPSRKMTVPYIPPTASTHSDHATLARRQRNSLHVPAQTPSIWRKI